MKVNSNLDILPLLWYSSVKVVEWSVGDFISFWICEIVKQHAIKFLNTSKTYSHNTWIEFLQVRKKLIKASVFLLSCMQNLGSSAPRHWFLVTANNDLRVLHHPLQSFVSIA